MYNALQGHVIHKVHGCIPGCIAISFYYNTCQGYHQLPYKQLVRVSIPSFLYCTLFLVVAAVAAGTCNVLMTAAAAATLILSYKEYGYIRYLVTWISLLQGRLMSIHKKILFHYYFITHFLHQCTVY